MTDALTASKVLVRGLPVEVGQVFESHDPREAGRRLKAVVITDECVILEHVGEIDRSRLRLSRKTTRISYATLNTKWRRQKTDA